MRRRTAGVVASTVALLVATVLISSQVLASSRSPAPRIGDGVECAGSDGGACGNEHSKAVRAWVRCKAADAKDACEKPTPPGRGLGHAKRAGKAPGPASVDGHGHGWGRAHAPGQLKSKTKSGAAGLG